MAQEVERPVPHIRTSERRAFKRCVAQWDWRYRKGLVLKYSKPDALWFGTGIHLALQHRYSLPGLERGHNVLGVWRDYAADVQGNAWLENGDGEATWVSMAELGEIMLGGYLDTYGRDERWYVISAEQTFEREIQRPNKPGLLAIYNGTFDLVARDQESDDSLWLWDHKTAKTIETGHLTIDDQAGSYWAVAAEVLQAQGLIGSKEKLDGILYNFLRKAKPDERPKNAAGQATNKPIKADYLAEFRARGIAAHDRMSLDRMAELALTYGFPVLGQVSKFQPTANFLREPVYRTQAERRTQIKKIADEACVMDAVRRRLLPITKNPTKDCRWDCPFFNMCELQEAGDDWREFRDAMYIKQDPYADHRKSADADS